MHQSIFSLNILYAATKLTLSKAIEIRQSLYDVMLFTLKQDFLKLVNGNCHTGCHGKLCVANDVEAYKILLTY